MVTVDTSSLAPRVRYVLYLVHPDDTEKLVSEPSDFQSGWLAGTHIVTVEDQENVYSLYDRERCVARFGHQPADAAVWIRAASIADGPAGV